jgi:hypothetical protein
MFIGFSYQGKEGADLKVYETALQPPSKVNLV